MTLVKLNQRPLERRMNTLFEDFFNQFPSRLIDDLEVMTNSVPVNIRETEKAYIIDVFAPGMEKSDFKVNVDNSALTISAEKKTETSKETERMVRREFNYKSFARTFNLDDSIKSDKILAKYENGVLNIELPKKEEVKIHPKEINIQ